MKTVMLLGFILMLIQVLMIHELPMVFHGVVWGHISFPISIFIVLVGFVVVYAKKKR